MEEVKKKVKDVEGRESDLNMTSLKKTLSDLEKERTEAEKKWVEIQQQEKVSFRLVYRQCPIFFMFYQKTLVFTCSNLLIQFCDPPSPP